jgi:hypothetical protein
MQVATIAGPAVGGLVFLAGAAAVYAAVAVLAVTSTLLLLGLRSGGRAERSLCASSSTSIRAMRETGLAFLRAWRLAAP